jgi:UDP-N-acetyl-D-galactosamine dehydrogenase
MSKSSSREIIGLVGLGYVGLPLALAFSKQYQVIGFDLKASRIEELKAGRDHTGETEPGELKSPNLHFTNNPADLARATFVIVAVPTPVNVAREPDLEPLEKSSDTVGAILKPGMMVVYESTVYPGVTEDFCLPILEKKSGLKLGQFDLGYSPERVNPGDKQHTVTTVVKVVSGHNPKALKRCAAVYGSIIKAGVHQRPQHQDRRGGQGDRKRAARSQHRPHERAIEDFLPYRHPHPGRAGRRGHQVELSTNTIPDWWAVTASGWIPTT